MQRNRKRKQLSQSLKPAIRKASVTSIHNDDNVEPYPIHLRPTSADCLAIRDDLLSFHGFPPEFVKYRKQRLKSHSLETEDEEESKPLEDEEEDESVLDGLVKTVLSQNTSEVNSLRAFASLKDAFPTWEQVYAAENKSIENAIRCGGLAPTKASCIKNILTRLLEQKGKFCLQYLRDLSLDEVKAELSNFKGIGPKTVACVLMFNLQLDDFPVDTHVFEIAKSIGWVPDTADRKKTYVHLNRRIPNELKFDLNCLLYTHGKLCRRCIKKTSNKKEKTSFQGSCPLLKYCNEADRS